MGLSDGKQSMVFDWTKRSSFVYRPSLPALVGIGLLGVAGVALSTAMGMPALAIASAAIALIPVPMVIPPRTAVDVVAGEVAVRRQPFYTNPALWLAMVCALLSASSFVSMGLGVPQAWRLVIPAVLCAGIVPVLLTGCFRDRGPLRISPARVLFGNGRTYDFANVDMRFQELSNGVPALIFSGPEGKAQSTRLLARAYNLDFSSLMSALEQLQVWDRQGRIVTPAAIKAMLTVTPPRDVEVGDTVQLTVAVASGDESA